jgi:hypothetical protein
MENQKKRKTSEQQVSNKRKNSPRNIEPISNWNETVLDVFEEKLTKNINSKNEPYYVKTSLCGVDQSPPALIEEMCFNPAGANCITICFEGQQYQRPLHRIMKILNLRKYGHKVPEKEEQCSHICQNRVNIDGKGTRQCCNPNHIVIEDDLTNKSRQRCAGWIWIHPFDKHIGGYWYPTCSHQPPCLRFSPITNIPTQLK